MKCPLLVLNFALLLAVCATEQPASGRPGAVAANADLPPVLGELPNPGDKAPRPIFMVRPVYPFSLFKAGIVGVVVVEFIIDSHGTVVQANAFESPDPEFSRAAVEAAMKWRFEPGVKNGRRVNTLMRIPITFSIE
jgi:TonB family protein